MRRGADIMDSLTPRGGIGLQVHGVGRAAEQFGLKVSFRHLRIRELKPDATAAGSSGK